MKVRVSRLVNVLRQIKTCLASSGNPCLSRHGFKACFGLHASTLPESDFEQHLEHSVLFWFPSACLLTPCWVLNRNCTFAANTLLIKQQGADAPNYTNSQITIQPAVLLLTLQLSHHHITDSNNPSKSACQPMQI